MEFLDEDARPRFIFQSRPLQSQHPDPQTPQNPPRNKPFIFLILFLSSTLLLLSILFLQSEPFKSLLLWLSLSLLIGPFCPPHLTGGDVRVGQGPILEPLPQEPPEISPQKQAPKKRAKPVRYGEIEVGPIQKLETGNGLSIKSQRSEALGVFENESVRNETEEEWSEEDVGVLKKQMGKNPVGKPRRWEVIAEAFHGRHSVESVITKAKQLGEKKLNDNDSYARFLKDRKPIDTRALDEGEGTNTGETKKGDGGDDGGAGWSATEDIALLNALKTFPKDVAMRWDKIAAAVPGKSKAACVKRVAELKRDFRSSKTVSSEG